MKPNETTPIPEHMHCPKCLMGILRELSSEYDRNKGTLETNDIYKCGYCRTVFRQVGGDPLEEVFPEHMKTPA